MVYYPLHTNKKTREKVMQIKNLLEKAHPELDGYKITHNFIVNYLCDFFIRNVEFKK